MLRPLPSRILSHTVTLQICTGVDAWQKQTHTDILLSRVCVQTSSATRKSTDNTDVELLAVCFVDARLSMPPGIDIAALKNDSDKAGGDMLLVFENTTYTVVRVDPIRDDRGNIHHYEIEMR